MAYCQPRGRDLGGLRPLPAAKSGLAGYFELVNMPTEDYPGPTKSHPEKEDKNDPPRPANTDPERPSLPAEPEPFQEEAKEDREYRRP